MKRLGKSAARAWPCVASGVLLLLAFPPINWWPLVFVALAPWLWSLREANGKEAWRSGYCLGFVYGLGQLLWVEQFVGRWLGNYVIAVLPWLVACSLYALYFAWSGVLVQRAFSRNQEWLIPIVWAGIEVFRSYIPILAFPWGLIAYPLAEAPPLIQSAKFGTIYWVSAMILASNVLLVRGLRKSTVPLAVGLALSLGTSLILVALPLPPTKKVVAIQPGVDVAFGDVRTMETEVIRNVNSLLSQTDTQGAAMVLLPEGMVNVPEMPPAPPFQMPSEVPFVFGGRRRANATQAYQTAFAMDRGQWTFSDKTRLVIFGEFVPGRDVFPFLAQTFRLPSGDLIPGKDGVKALKVSTLSLGTILCFELLFPDISYQQGTNGAQILAVMSVDDWYIGSMAPEQLRQGSIWRAVETGLPVVRSASLGHTFAADGHGNVVGRVPMGSPQALVAQVPVPERSPTFPGLPVFPTVATLAAFGFTLWPARRKAPPSFRSRRSR